MSFHGMCLLPAWPCGAIGPVACLRCRLTEGVQKGSLPPVVQASEASPEVFIEAFCRLLRMSRCTNVRMCRRLLCTVLFAGALVFSEKQGVQRILSGEKPVQELCGALPGYLCPFLPGQGGASGHCRQVQGKKASLVSAHAGLPDVRMYGPGSPVVLPRRCGALVFPRSVTLRSIILL